MIQRIQTVWLLLASICAFLTLKLSFYSGNKLVNNQKTFVGLTAVNGNLLLLISTVAAAVLALVIIFLFKDRKLQLRLIFVDMLLSILNIFLFFAEVKKFAEGQYDFTAPFVFLVTIFLILATRGIYKDQKLVKSMDRLR